MGLVTPSGAARSAAVSAAATYRSRARWCRRAGGVSVHGVLATPAAAKKGDIKAAILVLHGAVDPISPKAHRDMFEAEMDATGARWYSLIIGDVVHAYTDVGVNNRPVAVYDEPATRHGYAPRACVHRRRVC